MREILHIFKKDVRRHWPEILISMALLGYYVRVSLRGTSDRAVLMGFPWWRLSAEMVTPALLLFWVFLTVRVVQGETLVGDRQWWVTKPYEWWKLLLAKELSLLVFVGVPLFCAQLFLLHAAGFPVFPHIGEILNMQLGLAIFLFMPSLALAGLTKNLGQALLGVAAVFLTFVGVAWLHERVPSSSMASAAETVGATQGLLFIASIIGAAGWQYARRKTWASRGILLGGIAAIIFIGVVTPYRKFVEKKYPLVPSGESPAQIVAEPVHGDTKKNRLTDSLPDAYLRIPLRISGIAPGRVVMLDGIMVTIETPEGVRLDPGWRAQWTDMWTEDERKSVMYEMKRKEYEKIKTETARLHIELALTEYQEIEPSEVVLKEGKFEVAGLGICQLTDRSPSQIECRRPIRYPGLMASFDPSDAGCEAEQNGEEIPEDKVSHAWYAPHDDDSLEPGLNPVVDYSISFGSRFWLSSSQGKARPKPRVVHLCPGAKVRLAKREETRHMRVKLEMDGVRLLDLAYPFPAS